MGSAVKEPRVGCGAAILRGRELLLIKRLTDPEAATWSLPGGKVDWRETVPGATLREVGKELGIRIELGSLLGVLDMIDHRGERYHWVSPIYRVERFTGEPRILEPHKHGALGWFALDALPTPMAAPARFAAERLAQSSL
jgi:ADP-ribose pyrophosphatase YjhB (NUDIX family)